MPSLFEALLDTGSMPHLLFLGTPFPIWLHAASDGVIAIAYVLIPIALLRLVRKRKELPFQWIFFLFAAFILSCGATHLLGIVTLWLPVYRFEGFVKAITAVLSLTTALFLLRMIPIISAVLESRARAESNTALLAAIVASSDDAIISETLEGVITSWNQEAERLFGYRAGEVIGRNESLLFPPGIKWQDEERSPSRLRTEEKHEHFETTRRHKEGREIPVSLTVSQLRDANGNVVGLSKVLRDVSERLRTQQQIMRAQEKFQRVVEFAPNAMVMINSEGVITLVNAQTEKLFGYRGQELMGQSVDILVPERFRAQHPGKRNRVFETPSTSGSIGVGRDLYGQRKDRSEFPIEVGLNPIQTEEGLMVLSAIVDITERKVAEKMRLRAEAKFRRLLESAPDAVLVVNRTGEIVLVNTQTERLFGYHREELIGRNMRILLPEQLRSRQMDQRSDLLADPLTRLVGLGTDLRAFRKDSTEFPVEISLSPLQTEEGLLVFSTIRDITERKRASEQILTLNRQLERAAADAESANRAKSTFLSTMSHEIRTPLNAILGYAQLMSRDSALNEQAKTNLNIIGRSGEHLLTLINDVLDMSKIEAGHVELYRSTFNLTVLLEDLAAMFRLRAEAKALDFELSIHGEQLTYIVADEGRVRQVLINLVGNAIKFTRRGKVALHIEVEPIDGSELWLSARVTDTGPGISPDEQQKLFEPFSQNLNRLTTQEGTGLGLAISRRFARLMGGDVTVSSNPGSGSTFSFKFPVERGDSTAATRQTVARRVSGLRAGLPAPKILVVDDQLENRDWLMKLLDVLGFPVRGAENGEEALRGWEEWDPQMILMDLHMPVMDGIEATRRIKSDPRGKQTKVVVLTASAMLADRRLAVEAGADDFMAKPCREDELLQKINAHLNVDYDYEDAPQKENQPSASVALNSERLRKLPLELIKMLRDATAEGSKKQMNKLICEIGKAHDLEAAKVLQNLADTYEYETLTRVLDEVCRQ